MSEAKKLDEMIASVERTIAFLHEERKRLNKQVITNRQNLATHRNILRELKAKRREVEA